MQPSTLVVPDSIWELADAAHIKGQIEGSLLSGDSVRAIRLVAEEGKAVAQELTDNRRPHMPPYAFLSLVTGPTNGTEDEEYLAVLQKLYVALINTFGAPIQYE